MTEREQQLADAVSDLAVLVERLAKAAGAPDLQTEARRIVRRVDALPAALPAILYDDHPHRRAPRATERA